MMKLDLHDCRIEELHFFWQKNILTISIWRRFKMLQKPSLSNLVLSGITEVFIPRENPWGESNAINNASFDKGLCEIEMQSGDVIRVKCSEVTLEENLS